MGAGQSLLNEKMGEPQAVEVLCHEWAHVLAWNFAVDRLINATDTDPVEFEPACHDEAWGFAFSRVWLAGVSGRHPGRGVTAAQNSLGTVSKTVSKHPLGA
jgi:hypothetical protein